MTSGRGRSVLYVLVTLAILLLPSAVAAQDNCCTCEYPGGGCSSCCWEDQTPECTLFPDGSCGCYCNPMGGGPGCNGLTASSRTVVVGSDLGSGLADHQLQIDLATSGERRDGSYVFEEWALVKREGGQARVLSGSTAAYRNRVKSVAERIRVDQLAGHRLPDYQVHDSLHHSAAPLEEHGTRSPGNDASTILVVQEAVHPHNSRHIAVPKVAPLQFDAGLPPSAAGQEAWFRAEVGKDGVVDQVIILNRPSTFAAIAIHEQLREHLDIRYAGQERHRVVVFGSVRADEDGRLRLRNPIVLLPRCCCGGVWCA